MSANPGANGHRRLVWITTVGAVVVGAVVMFAPAPATDESLALPPELADEPDLYIEDATITQFAEDGNMRYQLVSAQIRHFEREQVTRLTAPVLTLFDATQPPWHISSIDGDIRKRARPSGGEEEVVFLRGEVVLKHTTADGHYITMRSPSIVLYPDRQYAETDQDVMIDTAVGRTQAAGMKGELQRGLLNLYSKPEQRVHTIVLPNQFK